MALTEIDPALRSEPATPRATRAPAQLDLRKITTPILLHLLRGKVRFPWLFLVKCKLTVNRFKKDHRSALSGGNGRHVRPAAVGLYQFEEGNRAENGV
jgi:hypothetical protein